MHRHAHAKMFLCLITELLQQQSNPGRGNSSLLYFSCNLIILETGGITHQNVESLQDCCTDFTVKEHSTKCHKVIINSLWVPLGHYVEMIMFSPSANKTGVLFTCSASSSGHDGYPSSLTLGRNSRDAAEVRKPLHISLGGVRVRVKQDK